MRAQIPQTITGYERGTEGDVRLWFPPALTSGIPTARLMDVILRWGAETPNLPDHQAALWMVHTWESESHLASRIILIERAKHQLVHGD